MILDRLNEFCDNTQLNTGGAGTYLIGNQIDLGSLQTRDIGGGADTLWLVIAAATAITVASGTGTISFSLASDDTASISTSTSTIHATSRAWATNTSAANIPMGTVLFAVKLPLGSPAYERYLGILQTTGTTAINVGTVDAFLTHDISRWMPYKDAVN